MSFIEFLRDELKVRGWSVYKLSAMVGIPPSTIKGWLYSGREPGVSSARKVAILLGTTIEAMHEEIGEKVKKPIETPEEILEKLKLAQPLCVPVYEDLLVHLGEARREPSEYIYRAKSKGAGRNIEAYIAHGGCMRPKIEDGDIVVIDRDLPGEVGDVVLCLAGNQMIVGRLTLRDGKVWLLNNERESKLEDCQISAKIIEVIKRL